ncbi:MAG: hypothetical protein RLZZ197_1956, partial [Bacteroidota bacterium]
MEINSPNQSDCRNRIFMISGLVFTKLMIIFST